MYDIEEDIIYSRPCVDSLVTFCEDRINIFKWGHAFFYYILFLSTLRCFKNTTNMYLSEHLPSSMNFQIRQNNALLLQTFHRPIF